MAWWIWALIIAGVIALGALKLSIFKKMAQRKKQQKKFTEED